MHRSGVEVLDRAIGGLGPGLPVVVAGASGSGRTVLALTLAAAAADGGAAPCVLLAAEPPALLLRQAETLGLALEPAIAAQRLVLLELAPDAGAQVRSHGARSLVASLAAEAPGARLWIIDPLTALSAELLDEAAVRSLVRELFEGARGKERAVLVTVEDERLREQPLLERALTDLSAAWLRLTRERDGTHWLHVERCRAACAAAEPIPFRVGPGGIVPLEPVGDPCKAADARAPDSEEVQRTQARPRVLVVDDDRLARAQMAEWLEERYDVREATDGLDAITCILGEPPDLLILDLVMPRVSGHEVLRALREAKAPIPVLVVSGYLARASDRMRAFVLGATDTLAKPVRRFELLHKVETLLRLPRGPRDGPVDGELEALLFGAAPRRELTREAFVQRLERAVRFGERFGLASTLLAVEAETPDRFASFLRAAERSLRVEDALLRLGERAAVVLLVGTEPEQVPCVLERLGAQARGGARGGGGLRWAAAVAESGAGEAEWKALFERLEPWPAPSRGRRRRRSPPGRDRDDGR